MNQFFYFGWNICIAYFMDSLFEFQVAYLLAMSSIDTF